MLPNSMPVLSRYLKQLYTVVLCCLMLSFGSQKVYAQNDASPHVPEDKIAALYQLGYFEEYARNTSESIQGIVAQLTEAQHGQAVREIISRHFAPEAIEKTIKQSLKRNYSAAHAQKSIEHLQQPAMQALLKQLYASDVDLEDAEDRERFERFAARMDRVAETGRPEEQAGRIQIMAGILQATRQIRLTVQSLEEMLAIVMFAINQSMPVEEQLESEQVNELLLQLRANFQAFFEDMMLYLSLFSTQEQSVEHMQEHQHFLETPAGRWFIRSYNNAILDSFSEQGKAISEALAQWSIDRLDTE